MLTANHITIISILCLIKCRSRTKELSRKEEERYSLKRKEVEEKTEQIKKEIEVAGKETARLNEIRKKLKRGLSAGTQPSHDNG